MDLTLAAGDGFLNVRVGAVICKDGKMLMVGNNRDAYYYSVGGRVQFGETTEQAVVREVTEETGVRLEVDHLGFVHENFFVADAPAKYAGKVIYELSFYYYMKVPEDFAPLSQSFTEDGIAERLVWVEQDCPQRIYPEFFRTELNPEDTAVHHIVTDERLNRQKAGK